MTTLHAGERLRGLIVSQSTSGPDGEEIEIKTGNSGAFFFLFFFGGGGGGGVILIIVKK